MIKKMRSILVALLVAMLTFSPATACHYCGGYGGGGYYYGGGYGGYYTGCYSGGGYSGGYSHSSGCCGGEVVISDGCDGCGSYDGCGCEGETMSSSETEPQMQAPEPPAHEGASTPSTVNRVPTDPAPALPTYQAPVPTTEPAVEPAAPVTPPGEEPRYAEPAVTPEPTTPAVTEPATEPQNDLFGPPSTDETPLPAEEPATPAETDDFFSTPATEPATDTAPATPVEEPTTTPPLDDELFGPPAEEAPAEEEKPAEESAADDDLFGQAETILGLPGGLSSSENRHWVDNTGNFSCDGRMLQMLDGKVRILKDTGRTTTVPLARLSQGDLEFVNRQASAQKAETLGKTAQVSGSWSN